MTSVDPRIRDSRVGPELGVDLYWQLLAQQHRLMRLRFDLQELATSASERRDSAKLVHQEAAAQLAAVEDRLDATERALRRYAAGKFGVCDDCGNAIPVERLKVRPEAHLCVPCCQRQRRLA